MTETEILKDTLLTLVLSGLSVNESCSRLDISKQTALRWLKREPKYKEYREQQKAKKIARESEIIGLYEDGYGITDISRETGVPIGTVSGIVYGDNTEDGSSDSRIFRSAINLRDVEHFKSITFVGEEVCFDISSYGTKEYCIIEAKYPHFAKTDQCGIPWTWLTVMNRERIGK